MLLASVEVPSRQSVAQDIDLMYKLTKTKVLELFQVSFYFNFMTSGLTPLQNHHDMIHIALDV